MTGFCVMGLHEGTRPKSPKGVSMKVCTLWTERTAGITVVPACGCKCHREVDKIFEAAGMERRPMDNPEYREPQSPYIIPDPVEVALRNTEEQESRSSNYQPVTLLDELPKMYRGTPTGKRQRGQLEDEVLQVCTAFMRGDLEVETLTSKVIAVEIDSDSPPSVGAIGAVFERWTQLGFANCEKGPVRFVSFTAVGLEKGLDRMKHEAKANRKKREQESQRTFRPRTEKKKR